MDIPAHLTTAFPPSPRRLFDLIRPHVNDEMLLFIARADYGQMAEEMFAQLRTIRDTGIIPTPMGWLSEVLELTRWHACESSVAPLDSSSAEYSCHFSRLFACSLLQLASETSECRYYDASEDGTLAQCISSTNRLGVEYDEALACFLTWRLLHTVVQSEEQILSAFGLLVVATRLRNRRLTDVQLEGAAEWVLSLDSLIRSRYAPRWDFRDPIPTLFSIQQGLWRSIAIEFQNEAATVLSDTARESLILCSLLLESD